MTELPRYTMVLRPRSSGASTRADLDSEEDSGALISERLSDGRQHNTRRRSLDDFTGLSQLRTGDCLSAAADTAGSETRRNSEPAIHRPMDTITITNNSQPQQSRMLYRVHNTIQSDGVEIWREVLPASTTLGANITAGIDRARQRLGIVAPPASNNPVFNALQASPTRRPRLLTAEINTAVTPRKYIVITANSSAFNYSPIKETSVLDTATIPNRVQVEVSNICSSVVSFGPWIWLCIRKPIAVLITVLFWTATMLFFFWVFLQMCALGYTIAHKSFLNNFCTLELPFVRDWACSDWEMIQTADAPPSLWNIQDLSATLSDDVTISLVTDLIRFETQMHQVKVRLPTVELSLSDRTYVRNRLELYLDTSSETIDLAQSTFPFLLATVDSIAASTRVLKSRLESSSSDLVSVSTDRGFPSIIPRLITDLSNFTIGQYRYSIIWLPFGPHPVLFPTTSPLLSTIQLLKKEIEHSLRYLDESQSRISLLQAHLRDMANLADEVSTHVSGIEAGTKRDKVILAQRRWSWTAFLKQQNLQDHIISRRLEGLEKMSPVFLSAFNYLRVSSAQIGGARYACKALVEVLEKEEDKLVSGWEGEAGSFKWVQEQVRILDDGSRALSTEVASWRDRRRMFVQRNQRSG